MSPVQLKMARAALDLSSDDLARKLGVSPDEIARFERSEIGDEAFGARVRTYLEEAGVVWVDSDGVRFTGAQAGAAVTVDELTTDNDK